MLIDVVGEINLVKRKGNQEIPLKIRISIFKTSKGRKFVDIRYYYYIGSENRWVPGKAGITIPEEKLSEFNDLYKEALEKLETLEALEEEPPF